MSLGQRGVATACFRGTGCGQLGGMQGWAAPGRAGLAPPPNGQWALGRDAPAPPTHVNMRWALHWTPGQLSVNREPVTHGPAATSPRQRAPPRSHTCTDASLVEGYAPPHHSPQALWLSGPRSSHHCSRGAFCSPGMLPAERILRKHRFLGPVPAPTPGQPQEPAMGKLPNATARGRPRRPEGGSRCPDRQPGSFQKPVLQPLWSLTSTQGLLPTCPHRPSRSPGSLAGMTPAAPQSAVCKRAWAGSKGTPSPPLCTWCTGQLVPPRPQAGGFLWGSPKLRGFGSCVGTRGLELWALCPKHLQGHSRAQAAALGQAEPSALKWDTPEPPSSTFGTERPMAQPLFLCQAFSQHTGGNRSVQSLLVTPGRALPG